jgi:hypothetical protein
MAQKFTWKCNKCLNDQKIDCYIKKAHTFSIRQSTMLSLTPFSRAVLIYLRVLFLGGASVRLMNRKFSHIIVQGTGIIKDIYLKLPLNL